MLITRKNSHHCRLVLLALIGLCCVKSLVLIMCNTSTTIILLPPANEVWGKVIFLHLFVIPFTGGACVVAPGGHAWLLRGCMVAPGGHAWLLPGGGRAWLRDTINERAVRILLECILVLV